MFGGQAKISFKRKIYPVVFMGAFLVLVMACQQKRARQDVLSEREMVAILSQLYLAEEKITRVVVDRDSSMKAFKGIEAILFEKAGTHDSVFRKSFEYYLTQPEKLERIYSTVIDSLSLKAQSAPGVKSGE